MILSNLRISTSVPFSMTEPSTETAFQSSPSTATRPVCCDASIRSETIAFRPIKASALVFTSFDFLSKNFNTKGLRKMKVSNETTAKMMICQVIDIPKPAAKAAKAEEAPAAEEPKAE